MLFAELIEKTNNLIDEIDEDEQIETIVKLALNEAYISLSMVDKRLTRAFLPIINGVCTLPNNLLEVALVKPKLSGKDKVEGANILTEKKGVFEILYSYVRERLVNDNDEPDIHESLQYAMIDYACYKYYMHRKKDNMAMLYYQNYDKVKNEFKFKDDEKLYEAGAETITDVWRVNYEG